MYLENNHLFIRADANSKIGLGHLMRCLALAQCWKKKGGRVTFIASCDSDVLCDRIISEGFHLVNIERSFPDPSDWAITEQVLRRSNGSWLVCDGYHFDAQYHRKVKNSDSRLLVIDDIAHLWHYDTDILLNQNGNAEKLRYSFKRDTHQLLGPKYVMLRNEYLNIKKSRCSTKHRARNILITLGGSDLSNQTLKFIKLINEMKPKDIEVTVVTGVSNSNTLSLQTAIKKVEESFQLIHSPDNMADIIAKTDVAISAGGSTCWELAFMGIPMLVVITAYNQKGIAAFLDEKGIAFNLGWSDSLASKDFTYAFEKLVADYKFRKKMSACGQQLIDGFGTDRIVHAMIEKGNEKN